MDVTYVGKSVEILGLGRILAPACVQFLDAGHTAHNAVFTLHEISSYNFRHGCDQGREGVGTIFQQGGGVKVKNQGLSWNTIR